MLFEGDLPTKGWLRLRYRTTLYGSAGRPILRFERDADEILAAMPAALFGTGEWVGAIPKGIRGISLSLPAGCPEGGFSLTSCEVLSRRETMTLALKRSPEQTLLAAGLRLAGRKAEASEFLKNALGATPMERYHEWRALNSRELDLGGLEARRDDWPRGPHIRVVVLADSREPSEALALTLESLERQHYPNWSLALVGAETGSGSERRTILVEGNARAAALWEGLETSDIVLPILAGDTIAEYAMAALVEFVSTRPDVSLFYADEDSIDAGGRHVAPELKPDWSPIFHRARPYVGRAVYFRCHALQAHSDLSSTDLLRPSTWHAIFAAEERAVGHIRRVLLTKSWKAPVADDPVAVATPAGSAAGATATLIVPTRDRADLLAACLAGLEKMQPCDFELLIVDNGSKEPSTRRLLDRARTHAWIRVLEVAGPFNFSALCNRAAGLAEGRVLVFLNNDTEVIRPDWLANLVRWAVRPDIGAVGAKLLYPSGHLQHAGLVLGLGGYAAHIESGIGPADDGYLGRLSAPREVSAVTGACLAVEKSKFDAVGGFDAEKYPIELGDVDLCLRLAQRGWTTVYTPDAELKHRESATRGKADTARRYAEERRHFLSRWHDAVADDPRFHPALSLTARRTSLDY